MGSKRFGGIRFQVHSLDHEPIHVHAYFGRAGAPGVKLELIDGEFVATDVKGASRSEVRKALKVANEYTAELIALYKEIH